MPTLPTIVPIIIVGIMVGSLLKSEKPKISFRRVMLWGLVAGALNAAWAYVELISAIPTTPTTFGGGATGTATGTGTLFLARSVSPIAFSVASFAQGITPRQPSMAHSRYGYRLVSTEWAWLLQGIQLTQPRLMFLQALT